MIAARCQSEWSGSRPANLGPIERIEEVEDRSVEPLRILLKHAVPALGHDRQARAGEIAVQDDRAADAEEVLLADDDLHRATDLRQPRCERNGIEARNRA